MTRLTHEQVVVSKGGAGAQDALRRLGLAGRQVVVLVATRGEGPVEVRILGRD